MKQYLKCLILVALVASIVTLPGKTESHQNRTETVVETQTARPEVATAATVQTTTPVEKPVESVEKPAPQPVTYGCGPHDPALVLNLIMAQGVPKTAAIQILGSWKSESGGGFDQCQTHGDGGVAWGLNSWHPGRRWDMPQELTAQVAWAINVELPRDCKNCHSVIMDPASSVWQVRSAIQQSTRWGVQGGRWLYADQFASMF